MYSGPKSSRSSSERRRRRYRNIPTATATAPSTIRTSAVVLTLICPFLEGVSPAPSSYIRINLQWWFHSFNVLFAQQNHERRLASEDPQGRSCAQAVCGDRRSKRLDANIKTFGRKVTAGFCSGCEISLL